MKKNILKSNIILAIQYGLGAFIPIFLMPLILKKIGMTNFGIYAIFNSWALIGSVLILYVFHLAGPVALSKAKTKNEEAEAIKEIFHAKISLFLIWLFIIPLITWCYLEKTHQLSNVWLLLVLIPISSVLNSTWLLQYKNKFSTICILSFIGTLASCMLCIYLVNNPAENSNDIKMMFIFCLYNLVVGGGTFFASIKLLKKESIIYLLMPSRGSLEGCIERLKGNFNLFISQVIALGYGMSGPIFIGFISGPEEAGKFSILEKVITPLISAGLLTHTAAYPKLVNLWLSDKIQYRRIVVFTSQTYLLFSATLIATYLFFENEINIFMLGSLDGIVLFRAFLCWLLIAFSGTILTAYYSISDQAHKVVLINSFTLFFALAVSIPLTYKFGALGWILGLVVSHIPILAILTSIIFKLKENPPH